MSNLYSLIRSGSSQLTAHAVVGMAVYREDRFEWVKQAVKSVLGQTYQDFLLIIVIDGDVSEDILTYLIESEKRNPQIWLLQNRKNSGLSVSMNMIVQLAKDIKPTYFFRMDSDDVSDPNRFLSQVTFLDSNPDVAVLGTSLVEINELGKRVGKRKLPITHEEIIRILPKRCALNHPTVVIRFSLFEEGFRYNEQLKNTQDYFLWADLCAAGYKFANLPDALLQFRRVNDFYKRRGLSKSLNEFKARFYTMKKLNKYSLGNIAYAFAVLFLRIMPAKIVKLAYKIDRYFLNK